MAFQVPLKYVITFSINNFILHLYYHTGDFFCHYPKHIAISFILKKKKERERESFILTSLPPADSFNLINYFYLPCRKKSLKDHLYLMYSNALLPSSLNLTKLSSTETSLVKADQDLSMLLSPKVHLSFHFSCFQQRHLTQCSLPPPGCPVLHLAFRTLYSDFPPTSLTTSFLALHGFLSPTF